MSAQSFGLAGASLAQGTFVADAHLAKGAARAESRTAATLNAHSGAHSVVLHDLDIPVTFADGGKPNIDHAVLSGSTLWLIDTKWWKPGFYWTLGRTTRRGWSSFPAADKQTMTLARDALARHLAANGVTGIRIRCAVIICPSNTKTSMSTWAMRFPGAAIVHSARLPQWIAARTTASTPVDPHAQLALMRLLRNR